MQCKPKLYNVNRIYHVKSEYIYIYIYKVLTDYIQCIRVAVALIEMSLAQLMK